jgi:hypothetical protein
VPLIRIHVNEEISISCVSLADDIEVLRTGCSQEFRNPNALTRITIVCSASSRTMSFIIDAQVQTKSNGCSFRCWRLDGCAVIRKPICGVVWVHSRGSHQRTCAGTKETPAWCSTLIDPDHGDHVTPFLGSGSLEPKSQIDRLRSMAITDDATLVEAEGFVHERPSTETFESVCNHDLFMSGMWSIVEDVELTR